MARIFVAVVWVFIFFDGHAQKNKQTPPLTLFSVGRENVSTDEFIYLYKKNHQSKDDFTTKKIEEYLKLYVNFKLKVNEARHRGIDTTKAFVKEYESYKEELKKPYLPEGKLLDSLAKVVYQRLQEELRVSHILILVPADASPADTLAAYNRAMELKKRALAGEDFPSLAALYSEEPVVQSTKGDLGYFTALQMVYQFENAAYNSRKGDITGPVRTHYGYHILKIVDRRPSSGEVEVSHILIRTNQDRDEAKAKNLIFEIYDELKGGMSWDELCKQYSDDTRSKNMGGKLPPFGVGVMTSLPIFEHTAFSLQKPGDFSDPFQTQFGWHIMRLERRIPLPSFEEMSSALKTKIARDERAQISKQNLSKKLKQEFSFAENAEVKKQTIMLADSSLTKGKWNWKEKNTAALNTKTLFTLSSKPVLVLDFLKHVQKNQRVSAQAPGKYMEQLYNQFVDQLINQKLEKKIVQTNPDFEMLLKEYYEGILLFDIMESDVWQKATEDSVGQKKFFDSNAANYSAAERAAATIYSSNTSETISALKNLVAKNDTTEIQKIVKTGNVRKESGAFQKDDRPFLGKVNWKPGIYSIENGKMYYLVQIKSMVPPGPLSFDEARAKVISDYQDQLEKVWLEQLSKKYPVQVNEKAKLYVVEKLKS